eukprot:1405539-Rhodomonas_salina.1
MESQASTRNRLQAPDVLEIFAARPPRLTVERTFIPSTSLILELADKYKACDRTIRDIWNRRSWRDVTRPHWTPEEEASELEEANADPTIAPVKMRKPGRPKGAYGRRTRQGLAGRSKNEQERESETASSSPSQAPASDTTLTPNAELAVPPHAVPDSTFAAVPFVDPTPSFVSQPVYFDPSFSGSLQMASSSAPGAPSSYFSTWQAKVSADVQSLWQGLEHGAAPPAPPHFAAPPQQHFAAPPQQHATHSEVNAWSAAHSHNATDAIYADYSNYASSAHYAGNNASCVSGESFANNEPISNFGDTDCAPAAAHPASLQDDFSASYAHSVDPARAPNDAWLDRLASSHPPQGAEQCDCFLKDWVEAVEHMRSSGKRRVGDKEKEEDDTDASQPFGAQTRKARRPNARKARKVPA